MPLSHPKGPPRADADDLGVAPLFTLEAVKIPRHRLPDGELPPDLAYQIIHDELMIDGNARLNLATFVTTLAALGESISRWVRRTPTKSSWGSE